MNIIGIIPARGGSKGIPQKNLRELNHLPLISYTIKSAKKSKMINRIIVSTDNKKIASLAKKTGVEVPFIRPIKLATSKSKTLDVILHTLKFLEKNENYIPDIVVILQPTSPLRTEELIDSSINSLIHNKSTSVLSVKEVKTHPFGSFIINNRFLHPYKSNFTKYSRRQTYPKHFYPTGAIYTFWYSTIKKYGNYYGTKIFPLIHNDETNIDIDNEFDFFVAEMILKYWKKFQNK